MTRPLAAAAILAMLAAPAAAQELRWAPRTDPQTMDPHAVNAAPVLGFLNNVYEGLVRRDRDMAIEPALATSWEALPDGAGWRFRLREGVTFHGGEGFDADDVIFSYERASSESADTASWFAPVERMEKVDDFTVDVLTTAPNPIFPDSIANWMIMDSGWAEANDTARPMKDGETFATLNANGTGPYRLVERQPDLRTVLEPYEGWWGEDRGNLERVVVTPIQNPATAVAALLSGDVDLIDPVPIQDADRLEAAEDVDVLRGVEARVIMLGFPHAAETLRYGEGGENPFRDVRVREAVAQAVNVPAILQQIMRGSAEEASQLVSPAMRGYAEDLALRPGHDPEAARTLLAEAGYPDGFAFGMKCPNDRYIADEAVCQAIIAMLARVGLDAQLDAMPVSQYWDVLRAGDFDMYLLGWSPGTFDAEHPVRFLAATPEGDLGTWNFGAYSNARVDELLPMIQSELDEEARQAMLDETAAILQDEVAYVPLYVEPLIWGVREGVEVVQRPDNFLILRWARME